VKLSKVFDQSVICMADNSGSLLTTFDERRKNPVAE
jgi:hypothetical protein